MVRSLDVATQTAARDRDRYAPVNFISILAKDSEDQEVLFGFTDYGDDVTTNVIDAETGGTVSRSYVGDDAPIKEIDPIPLQIGIEEATIRVVLNPLNPAVELMFRGHTIRGVEAQIHRGHLDPESMLLVSEPRPRHIGFIDEAPERIGAVGGRSVVTLGIVSVTRELTLTSPAKWSHEHQFLRNGDGSLRYIDSTASVPYWWGQESGK